MKPQEPDELSAILNSSFLIGLGFAVSGLFSMLTRIVLGRLLGPSGYGLISEGLAALSMITVLALLGLQTGVSRFMSRHDSQTGLVESALAVSLPLSIIVATSLFFGAGTLAALFGEAGLTPILKAVSLNIPAAAVFSILIGGFRGKEETFQKVLLSSIFLPACILISTSLLTITYSDPGITAYGYTLSGWLSCLIAAAWYFRSFGFETTNLERINSLIRFSLPLGAAGLLSLGITWSTVLLIGYLVDSSAAGLYNAALPISYSLLAGLTSVNYIFLPAISRIHSKTDFDRVEEIYSSVTRWLQLFTLPLLAVIVFKAGFLLELFFGESYLAAAPILVLLGIGQFIIVFFGPLGHVMIALGETEREAFARACALGTILAVGGFSIVYLGLIGAAIGFCLGVTVSELLRLYYSRKHAEISPLDPDLWKTVLSGVLASLVLVPETGFLATFLQLGLFIGLYGSLLVLLKTPRKSDVKALEDLLEESPLPSRVWRSAFYRFRQAVI